MATKTKKEGRKPSRSAGKEDIQLAVNELVWKYGDQVQESLDWGDLLESWSLKPKQVKDIHLDRAREEAQERMLREIAWPLRPTKSLHDPLAIYWTWLSRCARYKVCRVAPKHQGDLLIPYFGFMYSAERGQWLSELNSRGGESYYPGAPRRFSHLDVAFQAAEHYHCVSQELDFVKSNSDEVVRVAERLGLT